MLRWCEKNAVHYIVGLAKNNRLLSENFVATEEKQRLFGWIPYAAESWDKERQVIYKAEYMQKGAHPRFILTNLQGDPQELYANIYCARGEMENRIKEQQLGLFADRTSCRKCWANQFRLLLSSAAYILTEAIRRIGSKQSELARAQVETIRLKLLKIGTVIVRNTRRIRLFFPSAYPYRHLFICALHRINST